MHDQLEHIKEWAHERLRLRPEPPWNYYRLMQLIDAIEHLDAGPISAADMDRLQESAPPAGNDPPQEGDVVQLESVRRHREPDEPEQSPPSA